MYTADWAVPSFVASLRKKRMGEVFLSDSATLLRFDAILTFVVIPDKSKELKQGIVGVVRRDNSSTREYARRTALRKVCLRENICSFVISWKTIKSGQIPSERVHFNYFLWRGNNLFVWICSEMTEDASAWRLLEWCCRHAPYHKKWCCSNIQLSSSWPINLKLNCSLFNAKVYLFVYSYFPVSSCNIPNGFSFYCRSTQSQAQLKQCNVLN